MSVKSISEFSTSTLSTQNEFRSNINALPLEIIQTIFLNLTFVDFINLRRVSKNFHKVSSNVFCRNLQLKEVQEKVVNVFDRSFDLVRLSQTDLIKIFYLLQKCKELKNASQQMDYLKSHLYKSWVYSYFPNEFLIMPTLNYKDVKYVIEQKFKDFSFSTIYYWMKI